MHITPIPAFDDNYIWLIQVDDQCWAVDPGDEIPVLQWLERHRLDLHGILLTHFHHDHTGGVQALVAATGARVLGPDDPRMRLSLERVTADDHQWLAVEQALPGLKVLSVPGHTVPHLAWWLGDCLFCGDTLFSLGCGRLFDGTADQLFASLQRLAELPDETRVFPAHEYTLANLRFARHLLPADPELVAYGERLQRKRRSGPTLPVMLGEEKHCNPFLRCHEPAVQQAVATQAGQSVRDAEECFTHMRLLKDRFRG